MLARFRVAVVVAGVCLITGSALAQFPPVTDPSKDEAKCQKSTGSALVKFTSSKTKCVSNCIKTARKTMGPYGGCFGPAFTDQKTFACVNDPTKGAHIKARQSIVKACTKDCPECYAPSVCAVGEPFVTDVESQIDPFGNLLYCTEAGGGTPNKAEAKCEDSTVKALVKFVSAKTKCYQKCNDNILKGKIAPGSCDPPVPSDSATATCIFDAEKGAEAKAAASIDKVCEASLNPKNAKPACYSTITGTGWVTLVESNIDFRVPITACGSPSGAFVE